MTLRAGSGAGSVWVASLSWSYKVEQQQRRTSRSTGSTRATSSSEN